MSGKSTNARLVSIVRPKFDMDEGKWMGLPNDLHRGKWPVPLTGLEHAILCALLSLPPDGWDNVREWVDKLPFEETPKARAKALNGLERKGYLKRVRHSAGRGAFTYEWSVTAEPKVSAGQFTSPFTSGVSTPSDSGPILEDGQLEDGPSKDGPSTSSGTSESEGRAHPEGGLPNRPVPDSSDPSGQCEPPTTNGGSPVGAHARGSRPHPSVPDNTTVSVVLTMANIVCDYGKHNDWHYQAGLFTDDQHRLVRTKGDDREVCRSPLGRGDPKDMWEGFCGLRESVDEVTWEPLPYPDNVRPFRRKPA